MVDPLVLPKGSKNVISLEVIESLKSIRVHDYVNEVGSCPARLLKTFAVHKLPQN